MVENPALLDDIVAGDRDLPLDRADADIGPRDIAEQRHQDIVIARDRRQIGRIGGFDPAPELAPEIQFPSGVDAEPIAPKIDDPRVRIGGGIGAGSKDYR